MLHCCVPPSGIISVDWELATRSGQDNGVDLHGQQESSGIDWQRSPPPPSPSMIQLTSPPKAEPGGLYLPNPLSITKTMPIWTIAGYF
jgi:hypothetical protein